MPALEDRYAFSIARIAEFRGKLAERVPDLAGCPNLCIYTTGSFGRKEAGQHSDLDIFFVVDGPQESVSNLTKTLIDADLIRFCRELGYPEFSGDGEYLEIHTADNLCTKIGDRYEDAENIFTARMLLFLESVPLYNDAVYDKVIEACVKQYFRDFTDHATNFKPTFLVNDIVRFWKTLCLNYECARTGLEPKDKAKHRVKNLKLKFSRLMTCFSMLSCLCDSNEGDNPDKLKNLVKMTPHERIQHITTKHQLPDIFGSLVEEYNWFLTITDDEKMKVRDFVTDQKEDIFRRAVLFGNEFYKLLLEVARLSGSDLRYMVV